MKKHSKEWVLQDTINFYTLENRALNALGSCKYLTEDGKKCAVGRYLKKGMEEDLLVCGKSATCLMRDEEFKKVIPSWMKLLPVSFLQSIQILHDGENYWTDTGLSKEGIHKVKSICIDYDIDFESLTIKQ